MRPLVSVLVPTHDHATLLDLSVGSALRQTMSDFELCIIGDGVGPDTVAVVDGLRAQDGRVRWFPFPKGERLGEAYRHRLILEEARGEVIAYLTDDDLWFDDHLEVVLRAFEEQDFVATYAARLRANGEVEMVSHDLGHAAMREAMAGGENFVPLATAAHTRSAYERLPFGWRTTPPGTYTDLYMWQQWLAEPWPRLRSVARPTLLSFTNDERKKAPADARRRELLAWWTRMEADPEAIRRLALAELHDRVAGLTFGRPPLIARIEELDRERAAARTDAESQRRQVEGLEHTVRVLQETHEHYVRHVARIEAELAAATARRRWPGRNPAG